jgi:hypothetical protein
MTCDQHLRIFRVTQQKEFIQFGLNTKKCMSLGVRYCSIPSFFENSQQAATNIYQNINLARPTTPEKQVHFDHTIIGY